MKMLLVNGSPNEKGNTWHSLRALQDALTANGIDSEILWLGKDPMQDCVACGGCHRLGKCVFEDAVNQVNAKADEYCGIVAGSPVYYGGPNGRICAFLDRLFFSGSRKWHGKVGASVVICRRGGATAAFERLNMFFLMNNMIVPGSQYWNQLHGGAPGEVLQDAEGLQTMRTLAQNIAFVLNGTAPHYEKPTFTNFIR